MAVDRESVAMRALDLFSGIGGFALAGESLGIETAAFCEIEPFAVGILKKRFPGVPVFSDVRELGADSIGGIDIVCGGFPCQDLSVAGKRAGLEGERSGLWFEMLRVIAECRPAYVLVENVRGAVNLALDTVYAGLVGEGYKVYPYVIPASAVGAPHQRERLFVVGVREDVADAVSERLQRGERGCAFLEQGAPAFKPASECGVRLWPTPRGSDGTHGGPNQRGSRGDLMLSSAVAMWPTPKRQNANGGPCRHGDGGIDLQTAANGTLNPAWVEILMGFPIGWTDPNCDEPEPWPGWPALMGESQHPYEPPRTVTGIPHRAARLRALGNAVVPAQAYPFFEAIAMGYVMQTHVAK